jgi:hypothetical protein
MNIHPPRPRDHEDAARVAITWLAERHRKGWRSAFEELLGHWRPEGPEDGWQLDEDGMTMVSINAGEWLIARGAIWSRRRSPAPGWISGSSPGRCRRSTMHPPASRSCS